MSNDKNDTYKVIPNQFVYDIPHQNDFDEPYNCPHCKEEITSVLIMKTIGAKKLTDKQTKLIDSILPYLNRYREKFGLDTCLRKAHFMAQIALECAYFNTLEEYEKHYANSLTLGIFSQRQIVIDSTIVKSLENYLTRIFEITNSKGQVLLKSNLEIASILLKERPMVVDAQLYADYSGTSSKKANRIINRVIGSDGRLDFTIELKPHPHYGIPLLSRAYAPYPGDTRGLGNKDELSRDGWKFKGRGLKQLTGRGNYKTFSEYRNKNPFPGDSAGQIDFTLDTDAVNLKGNSLALRLD